MNSGDGNDCKTRRKGTPAIYKFKNTVKIVFFLIPFDIYTISMNSLIAAPRNMIKKCYYSCQQQTS